MNITVKEVLELVTFKLDANGRLVINDVFGYVSGSVYAHVYGNVNGNIGGNIGGTVEGDIVGRVFGTINGCEWKFVETPKEKVIRLIQEGRGEEAIQVLQEGE